VTLRHRLLRIYHYPANIVSWGLFAAVGLGLNLVSALLLLLRQRPYAPMRNLIRRLFRAWCAWLHATRLIYVRFHGFTPAALRGPAVYIANHPGLLDATFILSQLPNTICIFKPRIMRNPVLGPAARMAGYVSGSNGVDVIREVAGLLSTGHSLLIFPEGTRTAADRTLNPLLAGFALMARRARVPVRLISVRAPADLVPKGWSWWRAPAFPAEVDITLHGELAVPAGTPAKTLTELAADQLSTILSANAADFEQSPSSDSQL
jgi:1-acyl-sn-glycerol-3-phosphate acyltransferase